MTLDMKNSPLVILSLDAGDTDFIERWAKEGYLPAIAAIMERGCWGKTGFLAGSGSHFSVADERSDSSGNDWEAY